MFLRHYQTQINLSTKGENEKRNGSATLIRDSHALRSHRAGLYGLIVNPITFIVMARKV